jgi:hypothetical protein
MTVWEQGVAWLRLGLYLIFFSLILASDGASAFDRTAQVRAYTRSLEFDYANWMAGALGQKLEAFALGADAYLTPAERKRLVLSYFDVVARLQRGEAQLNMIYTDPQVADPQAYSADLRAQLDTLRRQRAQLAPSAEAVLQDQIGEAAAEVGLTLGGQPLPPVLFQETPLPHSLIVSPREVIRQDGDVSLATEMPVDQQVALEQQVEADLGVSALVVGIGGVGVYPTMVQESGSLAWVSEVVAHEWIHNWLTLRPLGMNYMSSPELRIMNETTASMAGKEIGRIVLERYYPELLPPPAPATSPVQPETPVAPPAFDFVAEMRTTRVETDRLLAAGQIDAAEAYMEARRVIFWENGYAIRRLNQAYFAFHGAYADAPGGGAAGADPVGAAVRELRAASPSLAAFINRISWMWSFEQLQRAVAATAPPP